MATITLLLESEVGELRNLSGYPDSTALKLGRREAERRKQAYSEPEILSLGWKLIREKLRAAGKLPREVKPNKAPSLQIITPAQVKERLFQAWLEGRIKEAKR